MASRLVSVTAVGPKIIGIGTNGSMILFRISSRHIPTGPALVAPAEFRYTYFPLWVAHSYAAPE